MKNVTSFLFTLALVTGTCYAQSTAIATADPLNHPVQCNNTGWQTGSPIVWNHPCAPLEVKSTEEKILSIPNTAIDSHCTSAQQAAYEYDVKKYGEQIQFMGCFD